MSKFGQTTNPPNTSFGGGRGRGDGWFSPREKWCCIKGTQIKAILTFIEVSKRRLHSIFYSLYLDSLSSFQDFPFLNSVSY